jgi:peptide/nickel transport system substrate-binding protein
MHRRKLARAAALGFGLALALSACGGGGGGGETTGGAAGNPVKGGTLRILNNGDVDYYDTANSYYTVSWTQMRALTRQLYSWDITKTGEQLAIPVPDLADGEAQSSDNQTWTFKVKSGIKYSQPATGEVKPEDFIYAVERMYDKTNPSAGQGYANLIKGGKEFGEGKAKTISGMKAEGNTLTIELVKPAPDFISMVTMPFFSPVPRDYASKFKVGPDYAKHLVGNGPYRLDKYTPNKEAEFVRNENWDAATDPLRKAWVDKISIKIGLDPDAIQQAIERGDADISQDTQPPNAALQRLSTDPALKKRFAVETTGCTRYMVLGTNPANGAIAKKEVRQAINYAIDKIAIQRARGGVFAGDPASTILTPTLLGYQKYDLYPTPDNKGDVAKAKELLTQAGFPNGLTLTYVGVNSGAGARVNTAFQASMDRVGIKLKIKTFAQPANYTDSLQLPAKRAEHQIGLAAWCPDWAGDAARSFLVPLLDGRNIQPSGNNNYGEYDNPQVNAKIDQALAEPDRAKRGQLWGEIDKMIMQDAAWAPFLYDKQQFFWSERLKNWKFTPWTAEFDPTSIWLNPNTP